MNSLLGREPGRRSPLDRSRAIAACLIFPPFAKLDQGFHRAGTAPILPIAAQVAAGDLAPRRGELRRQTSDIAPRPWSTATFLVEC
jgi:hypothetical protein